MSQPNSPLTMYFDGACPLCSREARFFTGRAPQGSVRFVDIAAADFDAQAHGLDPKAVHREIHARTVDGRVLVGIDALAQMWSLVPRSRWLATMTRVPGVRQVMQVGYWGFARLRPYLPGRLAPGAACSLGER
jgi:predicted DCC family thiol-disulfide oxidoreductase YuxK